MDRTGTGRPEFRLRLGYPNLVIEGDGAPTRVVELDAADAMEALATVAAEIRDRRGRLTAILPEREVWCGRARDRESASHVAGRALGVPGRSLVLRLGARGADGLRPVAAVSRATLAEARGFLARARVRPARMTGAGYFAGFAAPPDFGRGLPAIPGGPAMVASGLAAALALIAWLGPWTSAEVAQETVSVAGPAAVAEAEPAAVAGTAPAVAAPAPAVETRAQPQPAAPALRAAKASAPARRMALYAPPPRPRLVEPPVERAYVPTPPGAPYGAAVIATRGMPSDLPAMPEAPRARAGVPLTDVAPPRPRPASAVAAPAPVAPPQPATAGGPLPRPRAEATPAVPVRTAATVGAGPLPRPAGARASTIESIVATLDAAIASPAEAATPEDAFAAAASLTPRARPDGLVVGTKPREPEPAPVRVASLAPLAATPGLASVLAPEPRRIVATATPRLAPAPASAPVARIAPAPQPVRPKAVAVQPPPQPVRAPAAKYSQPAAPKAQPVLVRAPQQQAVRVVRAEPTDALRRAPSTAVRTVTPAPQPARKKTVKLTPPPTPAAKATASARPAAQKQPAAARVVTQRQPAPSREPALGRSQIALVGIFGGSGGKHALVQLPNGDTQRVRPGDSIRGVQVIAIADDEVRLRSRGRDSVLRLPD